MHSGEQLAQAPSGAALSTSTALHEGENPCGSLLCIGQLPKHPKLTQKKEMTHRHHQVKEAAQC